jgi:uncharacterized protein YukE
MRKLSKNQEARKTQLAADLQTAAQEVADAVDVFNDGVDLLKEELNAVVKAYNQRVEDANAFIAEIRTEISDFKENKSERWQEGEQGEAYQGWLNEWDVELSEIDVDTPDDVDAPEFDDAIGVLEGLPDAP